MAARPVKTVQVLDRFRDRFIDEMDANSVVHDLFHNKIISDGDYQDITTTRGRNQQNSFLHLSLKKCTDEVFEKACKIFIESGKHGNSRMKALGEEMLAAMNEAKKQSLVTAAATTAQFPLTSPTQTTASAILTQLAYDHPDHLILFRHYVSRKAAGKVKAVLEGLRLDSSTIRACITSNPNDDEGAAQAGLTKWSEGQGRQPPSWAVLIEAMEHAQISQQHVQGLKEKLGLSTGPGNDVLASDVSSEESSPSPSSTPISSARKRRPPTKDKATPVPEPQEDPQPNNRHTNKCSNGRVLVCILVVICLVAVVGGVVGSYISSAPGQSDLNQGEAEMSAGDKPVLKQDGPSHPDSKADSKHVPQQDGRSHPDGKVPASSQYILKGSTPVQLLLRKHRERFIRDMDAKEIAVTLKQERVIPEGIATDIANARSKKKANEVLYDHLYSQASEDDLKRLFKLCSEEEGYSKMNAFGKDMLEELEQIGVSAPGRR